MIESLARDVRIYIFEQAARTARIPQAPDISRAIGQPESDVRDAIYHLAARNPDWRRHTLEETEALLESIGLTDAFWNLR